MSSTEATPTQRRKRQLRGEKRIAEIVSVASAMFAHDGFGGTSMNAIAANAGISMGSLYQYFPNKEAIVDAVAAAYLRAWRRHREEFAKSAHDASLQTTLRLGLEMLLLFHREHAGVKTFLDADPARAASIRDIHDDIRFAIEFIAPFFPDAPPDALRTATLTASAIARGGIATIATELEDPVSHEIVPEIAVACSRYLIHRLGEPARAPLTGSLETPPS